uniref:Uncharacterized protein n=1 Tax=Anguilla anguilla TaxID=7936 RepID=A0A0E9S5M7_ANGAN
MQSNSVRLAPLCFRLVQAEEVWVRSLAVPLKAGSILSKKKELQD